MTNNTINQTPEQIARDKIDAKLKSSGWIVQKKSQLNLNAGIGVAVTELTYEIGEADYTLFVDRKPIGVIEAKKEDDGFRLTQVEEQSTGYANSKIKRLNNEPLNLVYESNGEIIKFTDYRDPKPQSRELFNFQRPETIRALLASTQTLRDRFSNLPPSVIGNYRQCQIDSINGVERLLKQNKGRLLIHMATGAGKTYTAISSVYRLLKYVNAKRVLFLVDTRNLGKQAEQEFNTYFATDDNRKFTELYNVQRLNSSYIATDSQVCISTIQRMYSILQGKELAEDMEEQNPNENQVLWQKKEPLPVEYNSKIPPEFFDFIIIDECHRSIYNLWRQVLEYFDAFLIGLTATPDSRTFGFFKQNIANEYPYQESVTDGVNVGYDVFVVDTQITNQGSKISFGEYIEKRDKLTRKKRLTLNDEDYIYDAKKLDKDVVNESQIRTIIRTFKDNLFTQIFTDRVNVPKTLIFAKTDSHADDIIRIVREEFGEENKFCKKITYKAEEDPDTVLSQFRNDFYPRIAVTVDMVATGTDIKPLECLIFMRDVKSHNYFEQMKGRGVRTIKLDDLQKVTPDAKYTKDHFIIIDAIGVTKSIKSELQPKDLKRSVPLKDLLQSIALGCEDEELFTTLATRLIRLDKKLTDQERELLQTKIGKSLADISKDLVHTYDVDKIEDLARSKYNLPADAEPSIEQFNAIQKDLITEAVKPFNSDNNDLIENIRKAHEQVLDIVNLDEVKFAGWQTDNTDIQNQLIAEFSNYINENKDKIIALQIFYSEPYRRKSLTYKMIEELSELISLQKPQLHLSKVYQAYLALDQVQGKTPEHKLVCLVSLLRRVIGIDSKLADYSKTVDLRFRDWIFKQQIGHNRFTDTEVEWLQMMKEHIKTSFHIDKEDFEYAPFDSHGGLGRMYKLFGDNMDAIIDNFNESMVA